MKTTPVKLKSKRNKTKMAHKLKTNSPDAGTNLSLLDVGFEIDLVDGTVAIKDGQLVITKGSAIALTLPPPTAGLPTAAVPGDDGKVLRITSTTPFAHVITCSQGFNGKGASGTATFGAAKGNGMVLMAHQGQWYNVSQTGITYA
jgi:hypothetical protein